MENLIGQFGYLGLFLITFLAASIVPLSSELVVLAMPALGYNIWLVGLVASIGNYGGAVTVYYMGKFGSDFVLSRYVTIESAKLQKAQNWFERWGPAALLMCWAPFIGDALCLMAGSLHMNFGNFSLWAFLGKGGRYVAMLAAWVWLVGY
jgi:membrane protein YqaA with SNARE-associated domain